MENHWVDASRALLIVLEAAEAAQAAKERRPPRRHRRVSSGGWTALTETRETAVDSSPRGVGVSHEQPHTARRSIQASGGLGFPFEALTPVAVSKPASRVNGLETVIRKADLAALMATYVTWMLSILVSLLHVAALHLICVSSCDRPNPFATCWMQVLYSWWHCRLHPRRAVWCCGHPVHWHAWLHCDIVHVTVSVTPATTRSRYIWNLASEARPVTRFYRSQSRSRH
jgi:hypothetical protein